MRFLFWLGNHSKLGQTSLEDVIGIIGHQLRYLGHEVMYDDKNGTFLSSDNGINMIVEGFTPGEGGSVNALKIAHSQGARFVIIATEEPTPKGFNYGIDPEMAKRQEWFPLASIYAEGILYLVPGEYPHEWYNRQAPAAHIELGYASTLVRGQDWVEPTYDFGFFGSLTKRRLKILRKLARHIGTVRAVRIEASFPSQAARDKAVRDARVIVQLRKAEAMGLVSSSRCNTTLCLGRPIIAEPHDLSYPWDQVIKFSDSLEGFFNDCLLARAAWRGVHAKQMERFRTIMTPEACIGNALKEIKLDLTTRKAA